LLSDLKSPDRETAPKGLSVSRLRGETTMLHTESSLSFVALLADLIGGYTLPHAQQSRNQAQILGEPVLENVLVPGASATVL